MSTCDIHPGMAARVNVSSFHRTSISFDGMAPPDSCYWCAVERLRLTTPRVRDFCHYRACRREPEPNGYCWVHGGLVTKADLQAAMPRRPIKELRTHVEHAAKAYRQRRGW